MRLWHKDLIPYLPQKQLVAQWRELCCIAKNIADKGTPNHLLVNKVLEYPIVNFHKYIRLVTSEMSRRGINVNRNTYINCINNLERGQKYFYNGILIGNYLYDDWMNDRYLIQCYYNLQEKYDCGGLTDDEWHKIDTFVSNKIMKGD